jgi:hypothetical protein
MKWSRGSDDGQLAKPESAAVDSKDIVYVLIMEIIGFKSSRRTAISF